MATIKDVAREAGVSVSTASRAFRDNCYIKEETRRAVKTAAKRIGYHSNLAARTLKSKRSQTIGIMLTGVRAMFFSEMLTVIEAELRKYGYRMLLMNHNADPDAEKWIYRAMLSSSVDGLLATPISYEHADYIRMFEDAGIPVLQCFSHQYDALPTVRLNDEDSAYRATKILLDHGHRRIFFPEYAFNLYIKARPMNDKILGVQRAMREYGMQVEPRDFFLLPRGGDEKDVLEREIIRREPTAIICTSSVATAEILSTLKQLNLSVPKDISLIAYDDDAWCEMLDITALSHPINEMGVYIASTITRMIADCGTVVPLLSEFQSNFILRHSVRDIR